jgi:hypothetical protein
MVESFEDLEVLYGPASPFSEHRRGDHITYTTAEGLPGAGTIIWCQARFADVSQKYIVAPDTPTGFIDYVMPSDIITSTLAE